MNEAARARDAALHFEAVKVAIRQNKDGVYITLSVHPQEMPVDLMMAHAGTRYVVAMVETDDRNQPVKGKDEEEGDRLVQSAGMLCRNPSFQRWLHDKGYIFEISEAETTDFLREYLGVESRSEIKTNREARRLFGKLRERFESDVG